MRHYYMIKDKIYNEWIVKTSPGEGNYIATIIVRDRYKVLAIRKAAVFLWALWYKERQVSSLKIHKMNGRFQEERTYPRWESGPDTK
jgi:hypothetical protein